MCRYLEISCRGNPRKLHTKLGDVLCNLLLRITSWKPQTAVRAKPCRGTPSLAEEVAKRWAPNLNDQGNGEFVNLPPVLRLVAPLKFAIRACGSQESCRTTPPIVTGICWSRSVSAKNKKNAAPRLCRLRNYRMSWSLRLVANRR